MLNYLGSFRGTVRQDVPKPTMHILDSYILSNGYESQTWVLALKDEKLYVAVHKGTLSATAMISADPSTWLDKRMCMSPEELNLANLYSEVNPAYTRFVPNEKKDKNAVYQKQSRFMGVLPRRGVQSIRGDLFARVTEREIQICEKLRAHPHPSIVVYLGVHIDSKLQYAWNGQPVEIPLDTERVLSLVFERYDCNLKELINRLQVVDVRQCLMAIAAGIEHLHSIGIVHADIKPSNIFILKPTDENWAQQYVIGDFDSSHVAGSVMTMKKGTKGWTLPKDMGVSIAEEDDDWYSFQRLKMWLVAETRGNLEHYRDIGEEVVDVPKIYQVHRG